MTETHQSKPVLDPDEAVKSYQETLAKLKEGNKTPPGLMNTDKAVAHYERTLRAITKKKG